MESEVFLLNDDAGEMNPGNNEKNLGEESNPWLRMAAEAKPFAGDGVASEVPEIETGSDSYTFDGVEYRNVDKIDILDNEGKREWLGGILENGALNVKTGLEEAISYNDNSEVNRKKAQLDFIERQQTILERMKDSDEGDIIGSLRSERHDLYDKLNEMLDNGNTTQKDIDETFENYSATFNLSGLLESETARRDPNYFAPDGMRDILASKVKQAEKGVDETMFNGYVDEDGLIRITEDGERLPSVATENAQIILEEARQDAEVFDSLMGIYDAAHNYQAPHAIKKEDFRPTIESYIDGHKNQISRLTTELGYLTKGTSEYLEKEAEIKKQKQHRNAAMRLATTYFG